MRDVAGPVAQLITTHGVEQTHAVAAAIAELIEPGDVLVLGGQLGAGKTAFTQGLGEALGVTDRIVSPTFTIERIYSGWLGTEPVRIRHLDVYRLENLHEALDLGLDEALDDGDIAVIEWGEAIAGVIGRDYLSIRLELGEGDDDRFIQVAAEGPEWERRSAALGGIARALNGEQGADKSGDDPC